MPQQSETSSQRRVEGINFTCIYVCTSTPYGVEPEGKEGVLVLALVADCFPACGAPIPRQAQDWTMIDERLAAASFFSGAQASKDRLYSMLAPGEGVGMKVRGEQPWFGVLGSAL